MPGHRCKVVCVASKDDGDQQLVRIVHLSYRQLPQHLPSQDAPTELHLECSDIILL